MWSIANRAVAGIALVAAQALFARALRPDEVGLYHLAAFLGTVTATLGTLGLPSAAIRFVAAELGAGGGGAPAVARRVLELAAAALAPVLALLAAAATFGPAGWRPAAPAVLVAYAGATGLRLVLAGVVQGFADFRGQVLASAGAALVLPAGALWILLRGGDATGALAVTALHAAAGAALLAWRARRALRGRPLPPLDPELRRRLVRYALGVSAMLALDAVVWQQSELLFLRALSPPVEVGLYAVGFTLVSQAMQLLPGSVTVALFPALSHAVGSDDAGALRRAWHGAVRLLATAAWPAGAVGAALAPQLLRLLYGEAFLPGAAAARLLWLAGAIGAVAAAPSSLLYALERQRAMVLAALPVAALNLALDVLLIPRHGALGAAIANTAAQLAGAAAVVALARREVGAPPWGSLARVAVASALGAGAAHLAAAGGLGPLALVRGALAGAGVAGLALLVSGELRRLPLADLRRGATTAAAGPHAGPLPAGERELRP